MISPAVVLKTSKYADDRLIVETYTREAGHQTFIIRISQGRRSGVHRNLFQPLALLEMEWGAEETSTRSRSDLHKPKAARPLLLPLTLYTDPIKASIVLFLAEFLRAILRTEPTSPPLYDYIDAALRWLDTATDRPVANFHIAFLIHITKLLGITPSEEELMQICPLQYRLQAPRLLRINLANQHIFQFTRQERAEFLRVILLYYRLHQTAFPELKSIEVLTEIFN